MSDRDQLAAIRDRFDQQIRRGRSEPGWTRHEVPPVVRHTAQRGNQGWVSYSALAGSDVDAIIAREVAAFAALDQAFEWKVYSWDQPADLCERLVAQGFSCGEVEAALVIDLDNAPASLWQPPRREVRQIRDAAGIADAVAVNMQVWPDHDHSWLGELYDEMLASGRDDLLAYVAYVDNQPVASARLTMQPGTDFAGLWGGGTIEDFRGQGIYHSLLAVRAQAARQRGYRVLQVDASPMSRPILERLGFQLLGLTWPCVWAPAPAAD